MTSRRYLRASASARAIGMTMAVGLPAAAAAPAATDPGVSPAAVEGVVVTAAAPRERVLLDRKVYSVGVDLQAATGVAADVLNQIPTVDVDADGNVTLRGDPNVTVLVDGKPSAQFSGATRGLSLQQFPAQDIDRIEVMTNPPAQYKAEGSAGVINIITRKARRPGLSGAADASLGDKRRFVAGVNATWNNGPLKLTGGVSLRQDAKERQVDDQRVAADPVTGALVASRETIDEHFKRLIPMVKLGLDYQLDRSRSVALNFSHRELSGNRYFLQQDSSAGAPGPPLGASDRQSTGHEWSLDGGEGLRIDQALRRPDETLSLFVQRSVTRERERYAYLDTFALPAGPDTQDGLRLSLDFVKVETGADYTLPMSRGRTLKLGYDFEDDSNRFDNVGDTIDPATGLPVDNPNVTNHFRYHQQVSAGYAQYEAALGPWTLQTGLRVEQTDVDTLQVTGDVPGAYGYFRAYPSLTLERGLPDDARLTLSLSRRVTRPDPQALNPFTDYQDTHNLRAGNANLLPQDTWSYQLAYAGRIGGVSWGLTPYCQFNRDSVTDVTRVVSADVVLVTKANLPKSKAAGVDFSLSGKLIRQLSYTMSGEAFYSQIDATGLGAAGLRDTAGLNAKASLDYKPTAADTAQISFSRTDRRLTPQGYVSAINLVNLGYRRRLWGGLSAVATVSDLFDGQRFQRVVTIPTLRDNYNRHQFGRVGYFGLSYTFGLARKAKPGAFDYDPG